MYERSRKFIIPLKPLAWKRAGLSGKHFFDQQQQDKLAFGLYLKQQMNSTPPFNTICSVDMTFFVEIPKSKPKRQSYYWAPCHSDLDNFVKFVLDTCVQSDILSDDHLVCALIAKKVYDVEPRTEFTITELI